MNAALRGRPAAMAHHLAVPRRSELRAGGRAGSRRPGSHLLIRLAIVLAAAATVLAGAAPVAVGETRGLPAGATPLLAAQQAQLTAVDGAAYDYFGQAVAVSGDTAVVGAPSHAVGGTFQQGAAYVYVRAGGIWTQQQVLTASDGAAEDFFGSSVAVVGDTVVVGAPDDDISGRVDQGSAYVYVRSGSIWFQQAKLTALDGEAGDRFGRSVALSGGTALVGALMDDVESRVDQGSAYVFVRSVTTWTQQAHLIASDGLSEDYFGCSVAVSGNTALVGAYGDDVRIGLLPSYEVGSAYVFVRPPRSTTWAEDDHLFAPNPSGGDWFGSSVAVSDDTALIGSPLDDVGASAVTEQGSAFVFQDSLRGWGFQTMLTGSGGATQDWFGASVALVGDTALIGAYNKHIGTQPSQGCAYLFTRSAAAWAEDDQLTDVENGAAYDDFGFSVALSGDTALVGATADDLGPADNQGSAWVFLLDGVAPVSTASVTPAPNTAGWNKTPVTVTLTASDGGSGVAYTEYKLDGAGYVHGTDVPVSADGEHTLKYRAVDKAGNLEPEHTLTVRIDAVPPVSSALLAPLPNAVGWNSTALTVALSASDSAGSGVAFSEYSLDGAGYVTGTSVSLSGSGLYTVLYRSVDVAGNVEAANTAVARIDTTKPVTRAYRNVSVLRGHSVTMRYRVNDLTPKAAVTIRIYRSGVLKKTLSLGQRDTNAWRTHTWTCALARGTYVWKVLATDLAGNPQSAPAGSRLLIVR